MKNLKLKKESLTVLESDDLLKVVVGAWTDICESHTCPMTYRCIGDIKITSG